MAAAVVEVEAFERRAPPAPTTPPDVGQAATQADADLLRELRKHVLLLAILTTTVIFSAAGLNPPGGFWSGDDGARLDGDHLFFCCCSTAFAASMVVMLLLMRKVFHTKGVKYWALQVTMTLGLFALIGAYAVGTCQTLKTFIYVVALVAAVLLYIGIQVRLVFLCKRKRRENLQIHRQQSRVSEQGNDDAYLGRKCCRSYLLLLTTLAATITYQAGLNPPSGVWEVRADDAGDHGTYPTRYQVFSFCNDIAFVSSLVVILILLKNLLRDEMMKHRALQTALAMDLFGLAGAYAARSCRQLPSFVNLSVLLVPVSLYAVIHVVVFISKAFPSYATWRKALREKMGQCVPGWLKKLFEHADEEDEEEAAAMKQTLEKRRRDLLLLLAILATALTYHAGMRDPCGDDLVHYAAFFYGNATAFVASLAVITTLLLLNRKLSARGRTRCYALWAFVILDVIGLTAAFAAGAYRRKTSVIDVFVLVLAILVCVAFQVTFSISETARGLVQWLGWPRLPLGADEEEEEEGSEDDELELGVAGGTDGEPYGVEISSPILGGALTLVLAVPVMAILANPVKLLVAVMVASIGVSIWRRSLAPPLRALARALQRRRVTPPADSNASFRERLMPALCRALGGLIHKLCSGTWLWSVFVVIWVPSLRPNLKLKFKMSSISAVLAVLVVSTPTTATTTATATDTGTGTTAMATVDARSTATSSVTDDDAPAAAAATTTTSGVRMGRRVEPLVQTRPRRNSRPNPRLIGQDWVN